MIVEYAIEDLSLSMRSATFVISMSLFGIRILHRTQDDDSAKFDSTALASFVVGESSILKFEGKLSRDNSDASAPVSINVFVSSCVNSTSSSYWTIVQVITGSIYSGLKTIDF